MQASNAASASDFVSAIQISCSARLAFDCWLFGSLASTFAVLWTQQRCSRVLGQTSPAAFQKPSAPSAMTSSGRVSSPCRFRAADHANPARFRGAVGKADELFATLQRRADQNQNALLLVFKPR